jgi:DNA modification methylase
MKYKLRQGDNLELLKKLPDNSVDSVVSDLK